MKNPFKLKLLLILLTCVTFTFAFSQIGVWAYESISSGETFAKGTKIAGISVDGLTKDQAKEKVSTEVASWMSTGDISFVFGNTSEKVAKKDALTFAVDKTINSAMSGTNTPLFVSWDKEKSITIIETISNKKWNEFHETQIEETLLKKASTLTAGNLELNLVEHLKIGESMVVSSAIIENVEAANGLSEWQNNVGEIVIPPSTPFSLLTYIEEHGIEASDETLSIIATGIYETIVATNFEVVERHISDFLPNYAKLGLEASIQKGKRDLVIYNINPLEYRLDFSTSADGLLVDLIGPDLPYEYKVELGEVEVVEPKIIKQYDSTLSFGSSIVKVEGENGSFISVNRITIQKGKEIENNLLSEDYYAPVHRVERHSLKGIDTTDPDRTLPPDETEGNEDGTQIDDDPESIEDAPDGEDNEKDEEDDGDDFWDDPIEMK